jgi:putative tryptophan/tyrosine transport system substrate-binding protein
MKARLVLTIILTTGLLGVTLAPRAQSPKIARVGVLDVGSAAAASVRMAAFRNGLRELGHVEGQNITIEWRFAEGQSARLSSVATELVGAKPDVLVSPSGGGVGALHDATSTIPIVMAGADAGSQLINPQNLARPVGNVTGVVSIARQLDTKRMELLRETLPAVSRVATFRDYTDLPYREGRMSKSQSERWGFTFIAIVVGGPDGFPGAFTTVAQERAGALVLPETPMFHVHRRRLAELAVRNRLAWIGADREYAEAGCLLSYGADRNDLMRHAAGYVDRILKGAKPTDLPVEQPTKLDLVVNLKTARVLGLTLPSSVLARADEVLQ